jgi:hypothetical protein
MSMKAPSSLGKFYAKLHEGVPHTANGGAIGDSRHIAGGGYHISPRLLRSSGHGNDYSLSAPLDNNGPLDNVSAQDWTFGDVTGKQGIRTLSARCRDIFKKRDPRVLAVAREWFGTIDGKTVTGYSAYRDRVVTSSDKSHLWHIHFSLWRERSEDWTLMSAFADAILGVPAGTTVPTVPIPEKPTVYVPDSKVIYLDKIIPGQQNSDSVAWVQMALNKVHLSPTLTITADYDDATLEAAKVFQKSLGDDVDGDLGPLQIAALLKAAKMTNPVEQEA